MPIEKDQLRGHLETLVLSVLQSQPAHGYEIITRLEARGRDELRLKEGTVYPVLYRLEKRGKVEAHWAVHDGRKRKIYTLTESGRKQLAEARAAWETFAEVVGNIVMGELSPWNIVAALFTVKFLRIRPPWKDLVDVAKRQNFLDQEIMFSGRGC